VASFASFPLSNIQQDLDDATMPLRYVRPQSYYIPFITSEYVENKRGKQQLRWARSSSRCSTH
jgi:hypothetical protein